ncbi:uncharacterized protein LOC109859896 [Pseudomyrmex gracilis]|uniref:uncharacterized protein LOC109859896 n=1 Tax=Pseudomyrmex gracilis TaxID=219809 RepID=UPI000995A691|nr:uncharacterized protein LOC109859896 [Pseudomyrmex gracilis]
MKICCIPKPGNEDSCATYYRACSHIFDSRNNNQDLYHVTENRLAINQKNDKNRKRKSTFTDGKYDVLTGDKSPNKAESTSQRDAIKEYSEEDAPPILLPCAICARTFMPQSLEKHARICERAAAKKRKPFDSAKQRIQGTELAEFLPKQETRRHQDERIASRSSWKKNHDEFLRTIREARGELLDSHRRCSSSLITSGAPTRANEKGMCPTCNRHFGIKAYDRHVAWCKDRIPRVSLSPATNRAKERLEARMRYRAPALKNRRAINREKYSPGSNMTAKISVSSPALVKSKDTALTTNCNREKQKLAVVRHPEQLKESPTSSGPMKSRLADRDVNSGTCKDYNPFLLAEQQMNDLLSDTSDQSATGSPKSQPTRDILYPLSHSSAFVKYPPSEKRTSLIAPPTEFDDLSSIISSSDSTETNSISREIFLKPDPSKNTTGPKPVRELSRRIIIDKSKALGVDERRNVIGSADHSKTRDKVTSKVTRSQINRSDSTRASSAPRTNASPDIRGITGGVRKSRDAKTADNQRSSDRRNNNYSSLSGSTLSLGSIISSSEADVKRSTSMFDELMTSFEEDTFPDHLRSLLNNESFDLSSPMHDGDRQRNGSVISDEELSLPESYRPPDHCKLSNDSAYI